MSAKTRSTQPRSAPVLDEATQEQIRAKARQITRRPGISSADRGDLENDLTLHILARLSRFDPTKAKYARFVRILLAHAVATVLRDRRRRKRRASISLEGLIRKVGDQANELVDPLSLTAAEEQAEELDVAEVLASLPPRLRRVAKALKTHSVTAAAKRLRMSRTTLYSRLAELRAIFAAAGLEDSCSDRRTVRARRG
jgi:RNA polymerase sigma factor (sigma-70 family)